MAPTALYNATTNGSDAGPPSKVAYTESLDGQAKAPQEHVVEALDTEPELAQLSSLKSGTVIGESFYQSHALL